MPQARTLSPSVVLAWLVEHRRKVLLLVAALAVAGLAAGFLVVWSGIYSVAASRGHWRITDAFLRFAMESSVRYHAPALVSPPLDDPSLVRLGAGHFQGGCAFCHGAPGVALNPVTQNTLPAPPPLEGRVALWSDQELFQIVKHGIRYAGMPAWPARQRDDEVWAVVAFLRQLPRLDPDGYRALAAGSLRPGRQSGRELAAEGSASDLTGACARCHGAEGTGPASDRVPLLHGQAAGALRAALDAYADRTRQSGVMQTAAAGLSPEQRQALADYYAGLPVPAERPAPPPVPADVLERGRRLAADGAPADRIPGCNACHGAGALPSYPRLAGLSYPYLLGQLKVWRHGGRGDGPLDAVMAPIARRLSEAQVEAAAAYYAAQRPPAGAERRP